MNSRIRSRIGGFPIPFKYLTKTPHSSVFVSQKISFSLLKSNQIFSSPELSCDLWCERSLQMHRHHLYSPVKVAKTTRWKLLNSWSLPQTFFFLPFFHQWKVQWRLVVDLDKRSSSVLAHLSSPKSFLNSCCFSVTTNSTLYLPQKTSRIKLYFQCLTWSLKASF